MSFFNNLSSLFGNKDKSTSGPTKSKPSKTKHPKSARSSKSKSDPKKSRDQAKRQDNQQIKQQDKRQDQVRDQARDNGQLEKAKQEAQAKAREILVEAKAEALAIRTKAERQHRDLSNQLERQQSNLDRKLDKIDERLSQMDKKEEQLDKERQKLEKLKEELTKARAQALSQLEKVSSLTADEAKTELFAELEKKLSKEMAQFIRQKEEEARAESEEKVREILVDAMKHGATDYVPEYTVSVVELPSEETKGKIIGKSGRNINTFEKVTGVDVDLDMSPTEVRLSCFDPVRREIAKLSLERLIKDGRIQPSRIEETVEKVRQEVDKILLEAGKNLCHEVGIYNLPTELMRMIGKFKYRFSYGQNLITHTLEETKIGTKLAHELGLDVNVVKLGCLLHDIGKVSDEEEGSHVELGVKIAKRFNMPQPVIDCIAQHHEDEEFTGPEQMAVYIVDAMSGARPGARYENYDEYVKRLEQLEEIATQHNQVKQAYAIQAGREVRVLLEPNQSKDDDVKVLSLKIKDEIQEKMAYPGTVTVTVIREIRDQAVAK